MTTPATTLTDYVRQTLPPPARWPIPKGYPDSLALCAIDAIQSLGVRYSSVVHVVTRYTEYRATTGGDALRDGIDELLATFEELDGPEGWADRIGNQNRTSTAPRAPLKATAILTAARELDTAGIPSTTALQALVKDPDDLTQLKNRWLSVPGQRSGISWRYLLMLAGVPGVKPDRMIRRALRNALGQDTANQLTDAEIVDLMNTTARELGVTTTHLDHALWRHQSGRPFLPAQQQPRTEVARSGTTFDAPLGPPPQTRQPQARAGTTTRSPLSW